jgi:hypothetical protein
LRALYLAAADAQTGWMDTELRVELLRRMEEDQAAISAAGSGALEAVVAKKEAVLAGNLSWLKQVIADAGWPGMSLVGEDGAFAAWLLSAVLARPGGRCSIWRAPCRSAPRPAPGGAWPST